MRIAFYKGKGRIADILIRWWTRGQYSHCELELEDGVWYSADINTNRVRAVSFTPDPAHWDFITLEVTEEEKCKIRANVAKKIGKRYDFLGIFLSQLIPICIQDQARWFCSETIANDLQAIGRLKAYKASEIHPNKLYALCGDYIHRST